MKRTVVVFDFDGTLTKKDTLLEFIKYACGKWCFYWGFLLFSPLLILMKLHLFPNWKAKEMVFTYFFKGMTYERFRGLGQDFVGVVERIKRTDVVEKLQQHLSKGHDVYVISASVEDWVRPWCEKFSIKEVLGTKIEVDKIGKLTGKFLSKNCYGLEKVNRLLIVEPTRNDYSLIAYGDSRGDKEIISFADEGRYINQ